jgi:hypothetical protein
VGATAVTLTYRFGTSSKEPGIARKFDSAELYSVRSFHFSEAPFPEAILTWASSRSWSKTIGANSLAIGPDWRQAG